MAPKADITPALCACGKPLKHIGACRGTKFGAGTTGPPAGFVKERAKLANKKDKLRERILTLQAELLAIDAKLEALKAVEALYLPGAKPASQQMQAVSNQPTVIGRPFRIGERG